MNISETIIMKGRAWLESMKPYTAREADYHGRLQAAWLFIEQVIEVIEDLPPESQILFYKRMCGKMEKQLGEIHAANKE